MVSYDAVQREQVLGRLFAWVADVTGRSGAEGSGGGWGRLRQVFYGPAGLSRGGRLLYWLVGGLSCVLAAGVLRVVYLLVGRARGILRRRGQAPPGRGYYRRLVRALAWAGFRPSGAQTPREFVTTVVRQRPALAPAGEVVERYYAIRYGGRRPDRSAELELARLLGEVEAAVRR